MLSACQSFIKKNKKLFSITGFVGIATLLGSTVTTALAIYGQEVLAGLSWWQWCLLFFFSIGTMSVALTPSTLIALISGYFLGWQSLLLILWAYPAAAFLSYYLGKKLDGGRFIAALPVKSKAHAILNHVQHHHWLLIIALRLSPVLPFALMNLFLASINMPLRIFMIGGFLGMLPRTLVSLWVGMQARDLLTLLDHPTENSAAVIMITVGTTLSVLGLVYIGQKMMAEVIARKL